MQSFLKVIYFGLREAGRQMFIRGLSDYNVILSSDYERLICVSQKFGQEAEIKMFHIKQ